LSFNGKHQVRTNASRCERSNSGVHGQNSHRVSIRVVIPRKLIEVIVDGRAGSHHHRPAAKSPVVAECGNGDAVGEQGEVSKQIPHPEAAHADPSHGILPVDANLVLETVLQRTVGGRVQGKAARKRHQTGAPGPPCQEPGKQCLYLAFHLVLRSGGGEEKPGVGYSGGMLGRGLIAGQLRERRIRLYGNDDGVLRTVLEELGQTVPEKG
jgi:hypothetical protein